MLSLYSIIFLKMDKANRETLQVRLIVRAPKSSFMCLDSRYSISSGMKVTLIGTEGQSPIRRPKLSSSCNVHVALVDLSGSLEQHSAG